MLQRTPSLWIVAPAVLLGLAPLGQAQEGLGGPPVTSDYAQRLLEGDPAEDEDGVAGDGSEELDGGVEAEEDLEEQGPAARTGPAGALGWVDFVATGERPAETLEIERPVEGVVDERSGEAAAEPGGTVPAEGPTVSEERAADLFAAGLIARVENDGVFPTDALDAALEAFDAERTEANATALEVATRELVEAPRLLIEAWEASPDWTALWIAREHRRLALEREDLEGRTGWLGRERRERRVQEINEELARLEEEFERTFGDHRPDGSLVAAAGDYLEDPSDESYAAFEALRPPREQAIEIGREAAEVLEALIELDERAAYAEEIFGWDQGVLEQAVLEIDAQRAVLEARLADMAAEVDALMGDAPIIGVSQWHDEYRREYAGGIGLEGAIHAAGTEGRQIFHGLGHGISPFDLLGPGLVRLGAQGVRSLIRGALTRRGRADALRSPSRGLSGVVPGTVAADVRAGVFSWAGYMGNPTATVLAANAAGRIGPRTMNGQFMYVVDDAGRVIIGTRNGARMPHPTLIGGRAPTVRAAGIVDIRNGRIFSVNSASGHFRPDASSLNAARAAFRTLGERAFHRNFQGYLDHLGTTVLAR